MTGTPPFEIRPSSIHGLGAFAVAEIPAGSQIVEYVGEVITKSESLQRCQANNEYIFYLDERHDLDGSVAWNPARFINHSCGANCDAEHVDGRIWIIASRPIRAGEELTFNYGYDLDDYRDHPCNCGSPECAGYILAAEYEFPPLQRSATTGPETTC